MGTQCGTSVHVRSQVPNFRRRQSTSAPSQKPYSVPAATNVQSQVLSRDQKWSTRENVIRAFLAEIRLHDVGSAIAGSSYTHTACHGS